MAQISHLPSFCVAGVALMVLGGALGPGFGACDARGAAPLCVAGVALVTSTFVSRGRRGTNSHLPSFCVAGVVQMALGGALGPGFGDARGAAPLCVAGVALGDIHLPFTWQAWYKLTSTVGLRGRRGRRGTHGFSSLFTHVMCRHVLWSIRHVVFSDLFSSSHRLFYWPVCAVMFQHV